jgi:aspartyl/asparaginyl beta-hydroxylase (cupin superfamily)
LHTGPSNERIRLHLGLEVSGDCGIRVAGTAQKWKEGELLIFDDSFEHEVITHLVHVCKLDSPLERCILY